MLSNAVVELDRLGVGTAFCAFFLNVCVCNGFLFRYKIDCIVDLSIADVHRYNISLLYLATNSSGAIALFVSALYLIELD